MANGPLGRFRSREGLNAQFGHTSVGLLSHCSQDANLKARRLPCAMIWHALRDRPCRCLYASGVLAVIGYCCIPASLACLLLRGSGLPRHRRPLSNHVALRLRVVRSRLTPGHTRAAHQGEAGVRQSDGTLGQRPQLAFEPPVHEHEPRASADGLIRRGNTETGCGSVEIRKRRGDAQIRISSERSS